MSNENTPAPTPQTDEQEPSTGDVREAIQRAREVSAEPVTVTEPADQREAPDRLDAPRTDSAAVSTEPYVIQESQPMPSAAGEPSESSVQTDAAPSTGAPSPVTAPSTTDHSKISIDADHPMAALYIQQPMPPTMQGNRLGGVLISLLATVAFSIVYAGLLAIWQAPQFPPSTFIQEGMLPLLTSLGFVLPIAGFLVALIILVIVVNRAGWWAYVLGGLLVALVVLIAAIIGYALSPQLTGQEFGLSFDRMLSLATTIPVLAAAVTAREVTVWFGAWIGARGRKVKARNAVAVQEYETKLQEVQAKLS